jgi:hypothetical protein
MNAKSDTLCLGVSTALSAPGDGRVARGNRRGGLCIEAPRWTAPRLRNKSYLKALRAAEMAAWIEPAAVRPKEPTILAGTRAIRITGLSRSARLESIAMAGLFLFAVVVIAMQFKAAFGAGDFLAGIRSWVEQAIL